MTKRPEDYTSRSLLLAAATLLLLIVISFIPPISAGGVSLRRASIFSDLVRFEDDLLREDTTAQPEIDIDEFHVDLDQVAEQVARTTAVSSPSGGETSVSWEGAFAQAPAETADSLSADDTTAEIAPDFDFADILPADSLIISVEDFGGEESSAIKKFYGKLIEAEQPVRIAFMGDSFVEGDILSADLRELLQDSFGGGGVGFVPAASPFTGFRQTVKTTSKGWTPYNIMQRKSVPEPYSSDFFVSGWVASASDGASTRWDMTTKRRHLDECSRARLLFISRTPSQVGVKLNDGESRDFDFEGSEDVRQIVVEDGRITSLEMTVKSGAAGFSGYGADFDNLVGVAVDNFSIRSNNGQAMFWTNPSINAQINAMRGYDLVILQYGLNIMQAERHDYSLYAEQIEKMIIFVQKCFPDAAILVLGVSDRSQKNEDGIAPMKSAGDLARWQREAALNREVAFWNTYDAMQLSGGMTAFVSNGWAGKDYTHITYAGGAQIARALYYAMIQGAEHYGRELRAKMEKRKPVLNQIDGIEPHQIEPRQTDPEKIDTTAILPNE